MKTRKLLTSTALFLAVTTIPVMAQDVENQVPKRGYNLAETQFMLQKVLGIPPVNDELNVYLDVNNDGKFNLVDVTVSLKSALGFYKEIDETNEGMYPAMYSLEKIVSITEYDGVTRLRLKGDDGEENSLILNGDIIITKGNEKLTMEELKEGMEIYYNYAGISEVSPGIVRGCNRIVVK